MQDSDKPAPNNTNTTTPAHTNITSTVNPKSTPALPPVTDSIPPVPTITASPHQPTAAAKKGTPTTPANRSVFLYGFLMLAGMIVALLFLNEIGAQTTTYQDASSYNSIASIITWVLAATTGILLAYRLLHPRKTKNLTPGFRIAAAVLGFVFGFIPGVILAIVVSYPLSQHACHLSGSKYC